MTIPATPDVDPRHVEQPAADDEKRQSLALLAAGVAHDFNNHLTGIFGNVDLLLRQLPADSSARPLVQRIEQCARHAGELTDVLGWYAGRGEPATSRLDLTQLVRQMARLVEVSLPSRAHLAWHLSDRLPTIEGEAEKIRQMVLCLTMNAAEAMGADGGTVTVVSGVEELGAEDLAALEGDEDLTPGPHVFFEVTDTGQGMDAATRRRLFDPFFSTKGRGRGLGMTQVLGVTRLHRGGIRVQSALRTGTTVRVLLPLTQASVRPTAAQAAPTPKPKRSAVPTPKMPSPTSTELQDGAGVGAGVTVLVVDDELFVRSVAQAVLEDEDFTTLGASDGDEALAIFAQQRQSIDLVLLDLTMPGLGGEETLRRLRQMAPDVDVVITSGQRQAFDADHLTVSPAPEFLRKPYRPHELVEALQRTLARRSGQ